MKNWTPDVAHENAEQSTALVHSPSVQNSEQHTPNHSQHRCMTPVIDPFSLSLIPTDEAIDECDPTSGDENAA